jgi:hypothetical protein
MEGSFTFISCLKASGRRAAFEVETEMGLPQIRIENAGSRVRGFGTEPLEKK